MPAIDKIPLTETSRGVQELLYTLLQSIRPSRKTIAVTESDSTVLVDHKAIWVGGAGNLALEYADGTTDTITGVPAGTLLPLSCAKVKAATTATNISIWL